MMLTITEWNGVSNEDTEIESPAWEDIEHAIRKLDGTGRYDVWLSVEDECWVGIGGGDGQYLVSGGFGEERFPTLVDKSRPSTPEVALTIGGQTGDYPGNYIHGLADALRAARDFYENDGFGTGVEWVDV